MTKRECAIVSAFTGVCMLQGEDFDIFRKYVEELVEEPVYTHELANAEFCEYIKKTAEPDFIRLCMTATD